MSAAPSRDAFLAMSRRELAAALAAGHAIDPRALDDTVYRGISLGLPAWVDRLAWKTFQKTFHRDADGTLRGWNVRLEQRGLDAPSVPMRKGGAPFTFGHFLVTSMDGHRPPSPCGPGLMLDYGRGGNAALDPTRALRDPIVALEPGRVERLLGWSYVELGPLRFGTPSFFLLEREGPLDHRAQPPSRRC